MPFWRKWVCGRFEVFSGQARFWQQIGWFSPFPVGVTLEWIWGHISKMLKTCFHVYQITPCDVRITKIYSLSCVGSMVEEIFAKVHPKVKWGQIFNNVRFAWVTPQTVRLAMHIPNIYTFIIILTLILEIITFKHICTAFVEQEVPMCKLLIFNYRKSIIWYNPQFCANSFLSRIQTQPERMNTTCGEV